RATNAANPKSNKANDIGSETVLGGLLGNTSAAVPCTPTVKPFQNSFDALSHSSVSNAPTLRIQNVEVVV
ncbi:MAG: hypothetical protein P8144_08195, partial [Gammaproteobacteria bacterium]